MQPRLFAGWLFFCQIAFFLPDSSPASPSLSPTDVQCISFAPNLIRLHNSNSTSLCLLIGLDAFLWSWSAADETGKLRTYRGAVLTVRVGGWLYDSLTQTITFFGYKFYKNMEVFWTKYGSSVLSAGLIFQRTSSNEKDSCKGKDRPLNHSSIFFGHTPPPSLKHFQRPASPCIWR